MATKSQKRDYQRAIGELEERIKQIRNQLSEQQKTVEHHVEARDVLTKDLQEYFRRRADIEAEYSRSLNKLAEEYLRKTTKRFNLNPNSNASKTNSDLRFPSSHTYHGQITPNLPRKFQTGLESASQNITLNNAVIDDTRSESAYSISADSSVSQSPNYQAYPDHFQQSSLNSIYQAWFHLLRQTKDLAHEHERIKQHAYISCMGNVPQMNDSTAIVVKRAKELFSRVQKNLQNDLKTLNTSLTTAIDYQNRMKQQSIKYNTGNTAYSSSQNNSSSKSGPQKSGSQSSSPAPQSSANVSLPKNSSQNLRAQKLKQRREQKLDEAKIAAAKAQNNYLLQLVSVNAAIEQYYNASLSELTDALGLGFHSSLRYILRSFTEHSLGVTGRTTHRLNDQLNLINQISHDKDKSKLITLNKHQFRPPQAFQRTSLYDQMEAKISEKKSDGTLELESDCTALAIAVQEPINRELADRLTSLQKRTSKLRAEIDTRKYNITHELQSLYKNSNSVPSVSSHSENASAPPTSLMIPAKSNALEVYFESLAVQVSEQITLSMLIARQTILQRCFELNDLDTNSYKSMDRRLIRHIASKTIQKSSEGQNNDNINQSSQNSKTNGKPNGNPSNKHMNPDSLIPSLTGNVVSNPEQRKPSVNLRHKRSTTSAASRKIKSAKDEAAKKLMKESRRSRYYTPADTSVFGSSLTEYIKASGYAIPPVLMECIKIINVHGIHQQGIFRIPGGHNDIDMLKHAFGTGENPIADWDPSNPDDSDINSIAGLLKLYLRELKGKMFSRALCDQMKDIMIGGPNPWMEIRKVLWNSPESILIVMRYLFQFLLHVAQNSDENMMDSYNLAVCFTPSLIDTPEEGMSGQETVELHTHLNSIVKIIIDHCTDIFSGELDGPEYENFIGMTMASTAQSVNVEREEELDENKGDLNSSGSTKEEEVQQEEGLDTLHSQNSEISEKEQNNTSQNSGKANSSSQEHWIIEAVAKYDFTARSERELTFHKGDLLFLIKRLSPDWWLGQHPCDLPDDFDDEGGAISSFTASLKGRPLLVPHEYIRISNTCNYMDNLIKSKHNSSNSQNATLSSQSSANSHNKKTTGSNKNIQQIVSSTPNTSVIMNNQVPKLQYSLGRKNGNINNNNNNSCVSSNSDNFSKIADSKTDDFETETSLTKIEHQKFELQKFELPQFEPPKTKNNPELHTKLNALDNALEALAMTHPQKKYAEKSGSLERNEQSVSNSSSSSNFTRSSVAYRSARTYNYHHSVNPPVKSNTSLFGNRKSKKKTGEKEIKKDVSPSLLQKLNPLRRSRSTVDAKSVHSFQDKGKLTRDSDTRSSSRTKQISGRSGQSNSSVSSHPTTTTIPPTSTDSKAVNLCQK